MDTAVVLVSGGINSLVATGLAAKESALALMHVSYGQRTGQRELACFNEICEHYEAAKSIAVSLGHFHEVGGNPRFDRNLPIPDARALADSVADTYVPGLLPTMLGLAFHWASAIGARAILVGASENDGALGVRTSRLFPDHRRELFHLYDQLIGMTGRREGRIELRAPLIEMDRGEVIRLGDRMGSPFEKSWSCEQNPERPCGVCYGCVSRTHGFVQAAMPDPILIGQEAQEPSGS
jgi:7-cyano-7-deazaguanine synthase